MYLCKNVCLYMPKPRRDGTGVMYTQDTMHCSTCNRYFLLIGENVKCVCCGSKCRLIARHKAKKIRAVRY